MNDLSIGNKVVWALEVVTIVVVGLNLSAHSRTNSRNKNVSSARCWDGSEDYILQGDFPHTKFSICEINVFSAMFLVSLKSGYIMAHSSTKEGS